MRDFIEYMKKDKRKAQNTLIAYERDLVAFEKYLAARGVSGLDDCSESDAVSYEILPQFRYAEMIVKGVPKGIGNGQYCKYDIEYQSFLPFELY